MSTPKQPSKLDDILEKLYGLTFYHAQKAQELSEAKQQIKDLFLELVRSSYHYQDSADDLLFKVTKSIEDL